MGSETWGSHVLITFSWLLFIAGDPGARAEMSKLNLAFGPELVAVDNARVMPETAIRQDGVPLRYR